MTTITTTSALASSITDLSVLNEQPTHHAPARGAACAANTTTTTSPNFYNFEPSSNTQCSTTQRIELTDLINFSISTIQCRGVGKFVFFELVPIVLMWQGVDARVPLPARGDRGADTVEPCQD